MDVKDFGNELKRMFRSLGGKPNDRLICDGVSCLECPFNVYTKRTGRTELCILNFQHIDEVIDIVTAWSTECWGKEYAK